MKEHMLQLLWKSHLANIPEFTTLSGCRMFVLNSGTFNTGDGPDFLGAKIRTSDGLLLYGSIEIHVNEQDWYIHKHHTDARYNNVILHVILNSGKTRVRTKDGYSPETLIASPLIHLGNPGYSYKNNSLPCKGSIQLISSSVIQKQFEQARLTYFQELKERLLQFWDTSLPISEAWQKTLYLGFADGLGISNNRKPMQILASLLLDITKSTGKIPTKEEALILTGLTTNTKSKLNAFDWHLKGSRPNNRPEKRIPELVYFLQLLVETNINTFRLEYDTIWKKLTLKKSNRSLLLYHIVYIPALYLLGELIADETLKSKAYSSWKQHSIKLHQTINSYFIEGGFLESTIPEHLGVVYQMKQVCMKQECDSCFIYKAITS